MWGRVPEVSRWRGRLPLAWLYSGRGSSESPASSSEKNPSLRSLHPSPLILEKNGGFQVAPLSVSHCLMDKGQVLGVRSGKRPLTSWSKPHLLPLVPSSLATQSYMQAHTCIHAGAHSRIFHTLEHALYSSCNAFLSAAHQEKFHLLCEAF